MSKVHILDKAVAERIAAGEVVERPASVVKELVENAIDAGASAISVEIREGGTALIRVGDDGSGMSRDDAALAVQRFATSKIATEHDLQVVRTLGFRGEALPSIAVTSELELLTRGREEIEGTRVRIQDQKVETQVAGAPIGTQVTVRGLFYNAPARRKFLKAPLRESELVQKTVMNYALAYPQIAFRLIVDGRESLVAPAASPRERVGAVWGREVAAELLEINYVSMDLNVRGFVSRPTLARASREWQQFYVNGRPIRSGLLAVMLERPFTGRLPPGRHPLAVIQIDVDPQYVDVNVHPRKAEVRFYQERAIYGAVTQAVGQALREFPITYQPDATRWPFADVTGGDQAPPALRELHEPYRAGAWRAVAQIHNTYLLAQTPEGLAIVDQHAAQEQIFYEGLTAYSKQMESPENPQASSGEEDNPVTQHPAPSSGAAPVTLSLTPREAELLREHQAEYNALGIEIEPFGENTFRVNALPNFVRMSPQELVNALIQEQEKYRGLDGDALRDKLAARAACVSAVKAGDALEPVQQQKLLDELLQIYSPATCPHGRPTFVMLRLEELERRFLRR